MRNFRNYGVYKLSMEIQSAVYSLCKSNPDYEKYALNNQMRRAAVSIASNIAEGAGRKSDAEFIKFLRYSLSSAYELETQAQICFNESSANNWQKLIDQIRSLQKQLATFIKFIERNQKR